MTLDTQAQRAKIVEDVLALVGELLMLQDFHPQEIDLNQEDFLTALGANSIDALELIITIEEKFGIEFSDDEINSDTVRTVNHFVDCICNRIEAR